ncbi:MAG: HEPN domain-containing protein [Bryobacteraceae bacterium]
MKPQSGAFLDKARELLDQANTMMGVGLNEPAGRTAYLGALHAAQALIFENTSKVVTSHKGVQGEFWRLTKDEPRVDDELRAFLSRAYKFKRIADYDTGPAAHINAETARAAIATARRFVDCVAALIPPNGHTLHPADIPQP